MSIICYFVNLETFAGVKKKKVKEPTEPKKSIDIQSISVPVKAIQFSKNKDDTEIILSIKDLTVTTNNKDEILTDLDSISDDTAQMKIITYSFDKPHMIKKVSFINSLPAYTLNGVKMQFLDSSNKIVNEIILSTQEKFDYTFPPYSQKDTKAELYVKQIANSKAIAEAIINADALTALQTNVKIITDNLATANKGVTDISNNILTYQNKITDNSGNITSNRALIIENEAKITEAKTQIDAYVNDIKKIETDKTLPTNTILVSGPVKAIKFSKSYSDVTNINKDMTRFYLKNLVVTKNTEPLSRDKFDDSIRTYDSNSNTHTNPNNAINYDDLYVYSTNYLDKSNELTYPFINPQIITSITFKNGHIDTYNNMKGVSLQFLDSNNSIIAQTTLQIQENYKFNISQYTQAQIDAKVDASINIINLQKTALQTQIKTLTYNNAEADIQIATITITQKNLKKTIDELIQKQNDAITLVNTLTEAQAEAKNKVYIQSQKAIKSALTQVKISSDGLRDSFIYNNYINMYVSDNYINLIKEQQKKMLDQAIIYATKAKSTIYNILDQTKLPLAVQKQTPLNGIIEILEPTELDKLITLQTETQKELQDMSELYTQAQILLKTLSK